MKQNTRTHVLIITLASSTALLLSGCGSLNTVIPNRTPDYRTSTSTPSLEVPPDLISGKVDNTLTIPQIENSGIGSYKNYVASHSKTDNRGFISVLPELKGVRVIEPQGALPYLLVNADANFTWQNVKTFLLDNGISLSKEDPTIGIMETNWLVDKNKLPTSGLGGLINGFLGLASGNGTRDRYRIRLSKAENDMTKVVIVYSQAEEKPLYSDQRKKDPEGFSWTLSDNKNPELQLEMTRRIALYLAQHIEAQSSH